MKIFCVLTIFISLAVTGLGFYLIVETALNWSQSYFAIAKVVVGGILALVGLSLLLAILAVTVSSKINKRRMKNKGGKK